MIEDYKKMLDQAGEIHASVNQMFDDKPYVFHLNLVLTAMLNFIDEIPEFIPYKDILAFGACFHDTIEDARLTYNDVLKIARTYFNKEDALIATEIVYALTNEKGRTRAERANDKYYEGIRNTPFASFVKACDRYANYTYATSKGTSMAKKYKQEMPNFISHIVSEEHKDDIRYLVPSKLIEALTKDI